MEENLKSLLVSRRKRKLQREQEKIAEINKSQIKPK